MALRGQVYQPMAINTRLKLAIISAMMPVLFQRSNNTPWTITYYLFLDKVSIYIQLLEFIALS